MDDKKDTINITISGQSRGEITAKEILLDVAFNSKNISEELRRFLIEASVS